MNVPRTSVENGCLKDERKNGCIHVMIIITRDF